MCNCTLPFVFWELILASILTLDGPRRPRPQRHLVPCDTHKKRGVATCAPGRASGMLVTGLRAGAHQEGRGLRARPRSG